MTAFRAIAFGLFGIAFGSFCTVLSSRLPNKESVIAPRSRCPSCRTLIGPRDNIPVLSWVLLGGSCRSCGVRISPLYPLLEVVTGAIFVGCALVFSDLWVAILIAPFAGVMPTIAVIDYRHKIIPNAITYPGFAISAGFILAGWALGAPLDPARAAIGCALYGGGLLLIAIVVPRGMGIGDVKLCAWIGFVLGSLGLAYVGVAAGAGILLGGIGGIVALALGVGRKKTIPFGPFLAAGALVAVFLGPELSQMYLDLMT